MDGSIETRKQVFNTESAEKKIKPQSFTEIRQQKINAQEVMLGPS
jgi:hypothetical protein